MDIQERFRVEMAWHEATARIPPVPVEGNWMTLDASGRVEVWKEKPRHNKLFNMWTHERPANCLYTCQYPIKENYYDLLVSQWKSCIIAINEIEEKPSHDAPLSDLIAVAAMLDMNLDAWL